MSIFTQLTGAHARAAEVRVDVSLLPIYEEMAGIRVAMELKKNSIKSAEELATLQDKLVELENKHRDSNGVWHAEEIIDTGIEPTKEDSPILHGQTSLTQLNETTHRLARALLLEFEDLAGNPKSDSNFVGREKEKEEI